MIQAINQEHYSILISKKGEAFLMVNGDNSSDLSRENIEHIKKIQDQYTTNTINGYCNVEGEYRKDACEDNDNVKSIKLDTNNIIAAYNIINGQDVGSLNVIFLKSDGTIDSLNIGSIIWGNENITIKKNIGGLKNIVTVVQTSTTGDLSGSLYSIAIENNGTQHNLISLLN